MSICGALIPSGGQAFFFFSVCMYFLETLIEMALFNCIFLMVKMCEAHQEVLRRCNDAEARKS